MHQLGRTAFGQKRLGCRIPSASFHSVLTLTVPSPASHFMGYTGLDRYIQHFSTLFSIPGFILSLWNLRLLKTTFAAFPHELISIFSVRLFFGITQLLVLLHWRQSNLPGMKSVSPVIFSYISSKEHLWTHVAA